MEQIFLRRLKACPALLQHKGALGLPLIEYPPGHAVPLTKQAHPGPDGGPRGAVPDKKDGQGVAAAHSGAGLVQPDQQGAHAAHAGVPPRLVELAGKVGGVGEGGKYGSLLGALKGQGGGLAQEVAGLHLGDVPGEGDAQAVVGAAPDGLPLGDRLAAQVVVHEAFPVGADLTEKETAGRGEALLREGGGTDDVLIQ